ncbi:Uncharacterised protein [Klebsiella pneumoniae]|nr:Uncharacterised protein [Klebsiella pneumoniae]
MGAFKQLHDEGACVAGEDAGVVVTFVNQVVETFILAREGHAVGPHVGGKKGVHRLTVFIKLNASLPVIEVKHRV